MNDALTQQLLDLVATDHELRAELASAGELHGGYHPRMAKVHAINAGALEQIVDEFGWPGVSLVGHDGAEAAWILLQHAIAHPSLFRRCLPLVEDSIDRGEAPAYQAAYLQDRIACFEDRPQRYGTQFDWDDNGEMSPLPLLDEVRVDEYRARVGLAPLQERIRQIRSENETVAAPDDINEWRRQKHAWAKSVGWLSDD